MNPINVCSSGSLVHDTSRDGLSIFVDDNLKPGEGRRGEITIANLGPLPARLRLSERDAVNGFAAGALALAIDELEDSKRRLFLGEIGSLPADGVDLGRFEAGESRTYRFVVLLKKEAPAEGSSKPGAGATYRWTASLDRWPESAAEDG